jgi:hypothetical protein
MELSCDRLQFIDLSTGTLIQQAVLCRVAGALIGDLISGYMIPSGTCGTI